jgi:hypothetical protein
MYPKLDKHCPFKARLAEAMDGDLCTICNHQVHDLDAMAPEARRDFLNGTGTVCVRYRMPAALAAAALAASVAALPAAAQEAPAQPQEVEDAGEMVGTASRAGQPPAAQDAYDGGEIVGSFARIDPCEIVETVRGRQTRNLKGCTSLRFDSKRREPRWQ